jgi:hypothetical protein
MAVELADIFRSHGQSYVERYGNRMLSSHRKAMRDITLCRTEALGGQAYRCEPCDRFDYSYHSCSNRHCPKCQNQKATDWLAQQKGLLLPVVYFMATVTLPDSLRRLARSHQKLIYGLLFKCAAGAIQKLARDPKYVGAEVGMLGVLQTWTRDLRYHPHVHFLIPAGGFSKEGRWLPVHGEYLMPEKALAIIIRAKSRDALKKTALYKDVAPQTWKKEWVVDICPAGKGKSVLKYLAPYVFRVAISNNRILSLKDGVVTFKCKAADRKRYETVTVSAEEFIRRFLQHILPRGFVKVRYYGFFSPRKRHELEAIQQLFGAFIEKDQTRDSATCRDQLHTYRCPKCGEVMVLVAELKPTRSHPFQFPRRTRAP